MIAINYNYKHQLLNEIIEIGVKKRRFMDYNSNLSIISIIMSILSIISINLSIFGLGAPQERAARLSDWQKTGFQPEIDNYGYKSINLLFLGV